MKTILFFLVILSGSGFVSAVDFKKEDRVVLLGNTFFEREVNFGQIETHLALALAEKRVTFRNLAWSGDTVFCHARSYFGPPKEGFDRLKSHLDSLRPTIVILCYGAVASFEGESGLDEFITGYERLMGMVKASTGARLVILSPPPCETLGAPLPDMESQNSRLALYRDAIKSLSTKGGHQFVDFFAAMGEGKEKMVPSGTENGVHFNEKGYRRLAPVLGKVMKLESVALGGERREQLRQIVIEKNRLFFNRWRPQNETYLHGFRKHEQGNNAKEIPQFDPLIAKKDKEIQKLALEFAGK